MHAVVVGCGRVGAAVSLALEEAGHSVAVIDKDRSSFRRLAVGFRGRRVVGLGFDRDHLLEAGIESAGALAAVTNGDNSNVVVARVAHETFHVPRVVARIYDPRRAVIYARLGLPTIAPVTWGARQVLDHLLEAPGAPVWAAPGGHVLVVERTATETWRHRDVASLEGALGCRVVASTRRRPAPEPTDATAADPVSAATPIEPGDRVWMAVAATQLDALDRELAAGSPL